MATSPRRIEQNLLDVSCPPLEITTLLENELTDDHLTTLLGTTSPTNGNLSVGLSGGIAASRSGAINALAIAVSSRVLVIQLRSKGNADEAARKRLEETIFCNPNVALYAFDLAPLALDLYKDHGISLDCGINIQSACSCPDARVPANATEFAVSTSQVGKISRNNINDVFAMMTFDAGKPETSRALALRSWLAGYLPGVGDMEERCRAVAKIDTKSMSASRLTTAAQWAKSSQQLDHRKQLQPSTVHDITSISSTSKHYKFNQNRFATRMRMGNKVDIMVEDEYGGRYVVPAKTKELSGQLGVLKTSGMVKGKSVIAVSSSGDTPTMADQNRDATILSYLQGDAKLFDNPFLQTIFPLSGQEAVVWPVEQYPVQDFCPPIVYDYPLNSSQQSAVQCMLSFSNPKRISIIQGPPGTGKTTVIGAYVQSAVDAGYHGIWLVAQSNVAVRNIAEKLKKIDFLPWKLIVSKDFYAGWHEEHYHQMKDHLVSSNLYHASRELSGVKVILSTLSMLSNPRINLITAKVPVKVLVVDEASQIAISQYISLLNTLKSLQKLCFIGDDKQLPPYGQDETPDLQSIFEISHLRDSALFLNTQYRMPPQIGGIISAAVYDGQLKSNPEHSVQGPACYFVDTNGTEKQEKTSWFNKQECLAAVKLAAKFQEDTKSFRIITPYEAQRTLIENSLKESGLDWQDKCFNVDSFQGNEDHYIIISVVRSKELGFLKDLRRTNVMLTRCMRAMYICTSWDFVMEGKGRESLVGIMADKCSDEAWLSTEHLDEGDF